MKKQNNHESVRCEKETHVRVNRPRNVKDATLHGSGYSAGEKLKTPESTLRRSMMQLAVFLVSN
jgi:hypothetical protein